MIYYETLKIFIRQTHQCPKECEEEGICKIVTEPITVNYENGHESFKYTKVLINWHILLSKINVNFIYIFSFQYSQTPQRLPCSIKIPPYDSGHVGKHVHGCDLKQNFHYCDVKCPNCLYYVS